MRALLQRVKSASVRVSDEKVGAIDAGLLVLAAIGADDTPDTVERMAAKIAHLRIFNDDAGKFNHSLIDVGGAALVVSQFTLYADTRRGRRPSFTEAAPPEMAASLVNHLTAALAAQGVAPVASGSFGASMLVELQNDGPVTIWLDSVDWPGGA